VPTPAGVAPPTSECLPLMGPWAYAEEALQDTRPARGEEREMGLFSRKKAGAPEVIDLREPQATKPQWGSPVPCPSCQGRGYLDHIDPYKEIMFLHCTECGTKYEVTKAQIELDAFTV
jgi:hypothetical protein